MVRVAWASIAVAAVCSGAAHAQPLDLRPHWRPQWARFDLPHLLVTGSAAATALTFTLALGPPTHGWKDDVLFDRAFRDALRADDVAVRDSLSDVSDVVQIGFILYPLVVDAGLVASLIHDDPRLGVELSLITLETFALTSVAVATTKSLVGRVRPDGEPCTPGGDDFSCRSRATRQSFLSGHTTVAFSSAGLICANHLNLDLYGGGVADTLACVGAIGLAGTTGALRVAAGRHYASDVVAAALVGFAIGYLAPTLLHYSTWGPYGTELGWVAGPASDGRGVAITGWF